MSDDQKGEPIGQVIQIDEARIRDHLGEMVRGAVEEALNTGLDAEADWRCGASRRERRKSLQNTRAGSYDRCLHTNAGEVRNVSALVARAVNADGYREILGNQRSRRPTESAKDCGHCHFTQ